MDGILSWIKEFLIIYLILTILMHLTACDQYKKYLRFFSGIILLMALISPVLELFGSAGKLESLISYEAFWEQLDSTRQDSKKLEFMQNDHYIRKYESVIADEIMLQAKERELPVSRIQVELTEDYEINSVSVWLDIADRSNTAGGSGSVNEPESVDADAAGSANSMNKSESVDASAVDNADSTNEPESKDAGAGGNADPTNDMEESRALNRLENLGDSGALSGKEGTEAGKEVSAFLQSAYQLDETQIQIYS